MLWARFGRGALAGCAGMAKAKCRCKQYRWDTSLCYDVVCMICDGDGGLLASFS